MNTAASNKTFFRTFLAIGIADQPGGDLSDRSADRGAAQDPNALQVGDPDGHFRLNAVVALFAVLSGSERASSGSD